MKKLLLKIFLILLIPFNLYAINIENTYWEYKEVTYGITEYYGFYDGNVYNIWDGQAHLWKNRPSSFAYYTNDFSLMYQTLMGSTATIYSFFNKKKAYQFGNLYLVIPWYLEYDLKCLGTLK